VISPSFFASGAIAAAWSASRGRSDKSGRCQPFATSSSNCARVFSRERAGSAFSLAMRRETLRDGVVWLLRLDDAEGFLRAVESPATYARGPWR